MTPRDDLYYRPQHVSVCDEPAQALVRCVVSTLTKTGKRTPSLLPLELMQLSMGIPTQIAQ